MNVIISQAKPSQAKQFNLTLPLIIVSLFALSAPAQAALQSRAGGTMLYDTDLNITWVADANLFKTQKTANPNLVNEIISNVVQISDIPNPLDTPANSGVHILSAADFNAVEGMSWFGAQAWVSNLNYGGFDDWRLPSTVAVVGGEFDYVLSGELEHLFYNELGGIHGRLITNTHNASYNLFSNIKPLSYWSSTELTYNANFAWSLHFFGGLSGVDYKPSHLFAWAVHNGDVAAVPLPATAWLFCAGLMGWLGLKRRNTIA